MSKYLQLFISLLEKQLIPTILSLVVAIITYSFLPETNFMIKRLGKPLFIVLIALSCFLLINLLSYIHKQFVKQKEKRKESAAHEEQRRRRNEKEAKSYNELFDSLDTQNKVMLLRFLLDGNKPLISTMPHFRDSSILNDDQLFLRTSYHGSPDAIDLTKYWITDNTKKLIDEGYRFMEPLYQFKLKEEIYKLLIEYYSIHGHLGSFSAI